VLGLLGAEALEALELAVDRSPHVVREPLALELLAQLVLLLAVAAVAELGLDDFELLAQDGLALALAELLVDLVVDLLLTSAITLASAMRRCAVRRRCSTSRVSRTSSSLSDGRPSAPTTTSATAPGSACGSSPARARAVSGCTEGPISRQLVEQRLGQASAAMASPAGSSTLRRRRQEGLVRRELGEGEAPRPAPPAAADRVRGRTIFSTRA